MHAHIALPVVDSYGVVMPVQAMDERLDGRLIQMAKVGCGLSGLLPKHHGLGIDEPVTSTKLCQRSRHTRHVSNNFASCVLFMSSLAPFD